MFADIAQAMEFSLSVTGPIFLVVFLGIILKYIGMISDSFIQGASKIVFNVAIPALLFITIARVELTTLLNLPLLIFSSIATLIIFGFLSFIAPMVVQEDRDRGVFVQGSLRGNLGVVGLALCANSYGSEGLAIASILMAVLTILYNILSLYTLNRSLIEGQGSIIRLTCISIMRNPIIISILCGLVFAYWQIHLPPVVLTTVEYFSQMALPLALLCIGGSLSLKGLMGSLSVPMTATLFKIVLVPIVMVGGAYYAGFRGAELGILFMLVGSPTATVSFIVVRALNGNGPLAANIVVLTTFCSLVTLSLGLVLLKGWGVI
ncbi:MAG: AEC family transporter [Emcibacter sp.]|nr:AEC family transporter [Emcibacter sp.]